MKRLIAGLLATALLSPLATAAEPTTVMSGLKNPSGVLVAKDGSVLVSDSGALQIIKVDAKSGESEPVITDFPKDVYGKGPMYDIGPLGLAWMNDLLVVGGGGNPDGEELVRIYDLSGELPKKAEDMKYKLGPIGPSEKTVKGEGNFYGVAVTKKGIYITTNGDDTKGWVSMAPIKDGEPGELAPYIATKEAVEVDAPVGITVSKEGRLVVSQMGEMNKPLDSLLTVYTPKGKLKMSAATDLYDIAGVAFSPKTGKLYAVDFAWMSTEEGGLFRLDISTEDGKPVVTPEKIATLDRPSALAFGEDGTLYVTTFGVEGAEGGALVKFEPGL